MNNINSSFAIILYEENIASEWIGVEQGELKEFNGIDLNVIFCTGIKLSDEENINSKKGIIFREKNVNLCNPFKNCNIENDKEKQIIQTCHGSPIYYKDYNSGGYVVAIINEYLEFQNFEESDLKFMLDMINKGRLLRKKKLFKGIDEDNIVNIDMSRKNFSSVDIQYFSNFDLKNLKILDLSYNSIGVQGTFYLSQGKFSCLESLNLNYNKIGDGGILNISKGFFSRLLYLYLMNNKISYKGIEHLVKGEFISNLIILTLDENKKIGDKGIKIMKEHKGWNKLNTLNLNKTGLSDDALKYLGESCMPKLKILNITGNKFTDRGKPSINGLRMNHIHVCYLKQVGEKEEHVIFFDDFRFNLYLEDKIVINPKNNKKNNENENQVMEIEIESQKKFKNNNLNKFLNY